MFGSTLASSLLLPASLLLFCLGARSQLRYEVKTQWDGTPLVQASYTTVELTKNGDFLNIAVSAPFYNSPVPPEEVLGGTCPERPYDELYHFEVFSAIR